LKKQFQTHFGPQTTVKNIKMRRNWYIAFGIVLIGLASIFVMLHDIIWFYAFLVPLTIIAIYDLLQTQHSILRNFPILGHFRFILEFIRPEIQQYFIENDEEEKPFNRQNRSIVYQRAKNEIDTQPFGTILDPYLPGYTWAGHSIMPVHIKDIDPRIIIGGDRCTQPYSASRMNISAMSFGSLSPNAIMALNQGAKIGGFAHNTGEGGISSYHLQGGDLVFQVGTGYFGCRNDKGEFDPQEFQKEALRPEVKMIELKLSQGAKPGHGGILPAAKLTPEIARVRKVPLGHDVISPIKHSTFNTPIELLKFIDHLRSLSGGKPVGFKICIGRRREFAAICKAMLETHILPDFITVDGGEGGTGAAPLEFSNHLGEPLESALLYVHNTLVGTNLRDKIRIICSGKIITGFDMISHIALGADIFNLARGMMLSLGCIQSRQCNLNTCPTGVATQSRHLQWGLVVAEKKIRVANFHQNTINSFLEIVGAMGLKNPSEIKPDFIKRRINETTVKTFDEMFDYIEPGALLKQNLPKGFQKIWTLSSAEKF
jgi:glutamate synthase domain-containing protein 2